jgi:CarD family transcriptional regulator
MTRSAGIAALRPFGPLAANDETTPRQAAVRPMVATVKEASERTMDEQQSTADASAEANEAKEIEETETEETEAGDSDPVAARSAEERRPHNGPNLTPRLIAKAEVFVEGDHVVYPTHGVGKVERIAVEEIAGHRLELIHITFEENRMTLRVPVTKARTAGLRKLSSNDEFAKALDVLRGRARVKRTMWSRRAQEYEAKINSGDPVAIAEVVRDLHRNAGQPDQSFSERQIYEAALDRLAAELAALDGSNKAVAINKLTDFMKAS